MRVCEVSGKTFQSGNNVSHAVTRLAGDLNLIYKKRGFLAVFLGFVQFESLLRV